MIINEVDFAFKTRCLVILVLICVQQVTHKTYSVWKTTGADCVAVINRATSVRHNLQYNVRQCGKSDWESGKITWLMELCTC